MAPTRVDQTTDGCVSPPGSFFLGGLGFPGSDILPAGGWLRRAAIAFYALLLILVLVVLVLLIVQR